MVILDTDHLSILERAGSAESERLLRRLSSMAPDQVFTTIVTYEEQTRGWFAYMARAKSMASQIQAYERLMLHLRTFEKIPLLPFDSRAAIEFQRFRAMRVRIGTFDLRIAAIALARKATLLSRNLSDFRQIPGLRVEDWTL